MPRKSYRKKNVSKRRVQRRRGRFSRRKGGLPRKGGSRITKMVSPASQFPDKAYTKLKYVEYVDFSGITGIPQNYQFRGNSVFDPDYSSGGGQPLYLDQWTSVYAKYLCLGSKISVTYYPTTGSGGELPSTVIIVPSKESSFSDSLRTACERPYSKYRDVDYYSANGKSRVVKNYVSSGKMFGVDGKQVYNELTEFASAVTTNPTNTFYWNIVCGPMVGTGTWAGTAKVTIIYYTMFYERINVAVS